MLLKKTKIFLVLTDDWELRGNGSGDINKIQFESIKKLTSIYNEYGIKGSFNVEVMQQLTFRKLQSKYKELKVLADEWESCVKDIYQQGHDIQLHIHPQWSEAYYNSGIWELNGDWSILNYNQNDVQKMLTDGIMYLESILRPINPNYKCISFRSGAWCIAPSLYMLKSLVNAGIKMDISIAAGLKYHTRNIKLDYTTCEEGFLPYYPYIEDARYISDKEEPIICIPTNHFYESRYYLFRWHIGIIKRKLNNIFNQKKINIYNENLDDIKEIYNEWQEISEENNTYEMHNFKESVIISIFKQYLYGGNYHVSDLAQLDYSLLKEMLKQIRKKAIKSDLDIVPIIIENHTKDINDFSYIKRFIEKVSNSDDIECITLTQLYSGFQNGQFSIKRRRKK